MVLYHCLCLAEQLSLALKAWFDAGQVSELSVYLAGTGYLTLFRGGEGEG